MIDMKGPYKIVLLNRFFQLMDNAVCFVWVDLINFNTVLSYLKLYCIQMCQSTFKTKYVYYFVHFRQYT